MKTKTINKIMTSEEIDKKLNGQWVLIKEPTIKNGHMLKGLVLFSGGEKEILNKAEKLNLKRGAFFRAGGAVEESLYLYM